MSVARSRGATRTVLFVFGLALVIAVTVLRRMTAQSPAQVDRPAP
jgi:hypothetical protein